MNCIHNLLVLTTEELINFIKYSIVLLHDYLHIYAFTMNNYSMIMLSREELKQVSVEQRDVILNKLLGVGRTILAKIDEYKNLPNVVVFTGLRRVGKSTLLRQIISKYYLDDDFYYINFEDEHLFNFKAEIFNGVKSY